MSLTKEAAEHLAAKKRLGDEARQRAALQLACGVDLDEALRCGGSTLAALVARLRRAIERERLKGANRHWSYDLNRHIALKQALDRLGIARQRDPSQMTPAPAT